MDKKIITARIHQYQKPLSLDNTSMPKITHGEEVIVKVGATGLCHSDLHLIELRMERSYSSLIYQRHQVMK